MNPEEIARRLLNVDKDNNQIDNKIFNNYSNRKYIKTRKILRNDTKLENRKYSIEAHKKVALRLRKKLIESGKTPNLDAKFYAMTNL